MPPTLYVHQTIRVDGLASSRALKPDTFDYDGYSLVVENMSNEGSAARINWSGGQVDSLGPGKRFYTIPKGATTFTIENLTAQVITFKMYARREVNP